MAQWTRRLTMDQKIRGSSPARVEKNFGSTEFWSLNLSLAKRALYWLRYTPVDVQHTLFLTQKTFFHEIRYCACVVPHFAYLSYMFLDTIFVHLFKFRRSLYGIMTISRVWPEDGRTRPGNKASSLIFDDVTQFRDYYIKYLSPWVKPLSLKVAAN